MTSTVKFDRWQNTAGDTIADVSSGGFTGDNLLYNGAMRVAQRGTSATGLTNGSNGYYTADRWAWQELGAPTFVVTESIEADGPTGSGFTKSLKETITTAQASLAAADILAVYQGLEGQDLQGLKKGTSDAESVTLSFWVKSNVTGTYIAELTDADNSRSISASYTVSSSGTWEKKTVTFAGDTTGTLDNDNNASLYVRFDLAAGSNYTSGSLATSWESTTNANRMVGQTNLAASTSNYWQVTGVQLEVGTVANGFEHKPFGVELAECQRYYQRYDLDNNESPIAVGFGRTSTLADFQVSFPVEMRSIPSFLEYSNLGTLKPGVHLQNVTNLTFYSPARVGTGLVATSSSITLNVPYFLSSRTGTSPNYLAFSAEL